MTLPLAYSIGAEMVLYTTTYALWQWDGQEARWKMLGWSPQVGYPMAGPPTYGNPIDDLRALGLPAVEEKAPFYFAASWVFDPYSKVWSRLTYADLANYRSAA